MKKEMKGEVLDKFLEELLAAKTFKEAKVIEKKYSAEYDEDDFIRSVMTYGRESEMAQAVAYMKDLEEKQPLTIRLRLSKKIKRVRLFLYYHKTTAYYMAFLPAVIEISTLEGIVMPMETLGQIIFNSAMTLLVSMSVGSWFERRMHKVMEHVS